MKNVTVVFSLNFPYAVIKNSNKPLRQVTYFGEATRCKINFEFSCIYFWVVVISINVPS